VFDVIPHPGAEFGPCAVDCDHPECVESRATAALQCVVCGEPIGYDQRFTIESLDWSRIVHMHCALVLYERPRSHT